MEELGKIRNFTDLVVWQEGHRLALLIYRRTKKFPKVEQFGLVSQMQRAAVSVTSNVAEGFGRRSAKEKRQFYYIASGSLTELQNQVLLSRDLGYINIQEYHEIDALIFPVSRMLYGLIAKT